MLAKWGSGRSEMVRFVLKTGKKEELGSAWGIRTPDLLLEREVS